jgi:hypothetical protein
LASRLLDAEAMSGEEVSEERKVVGICIGLLAVIIPPLLLSDGTGTASFWTVFAAVAGAIAGIMVLEWRAWYSGLIGGAAAGACAFRLAAWWVSWRSVVHSTEMCLVALVGAIPGFALAAAIHPRARPPADKSQ